MTIDIKCNIKNFVLHESLKNFNKGIEINNKIYVSPSIFKLLDEHRDDQKILKSILENLEIESLINMITGVN